MKEPTEKSLDEKNISEQSVAFSQAIHNAITGGDFDTATKLLQLERGEIQNDLSATMRLCCGVERHEYESFALSHFGRLLSRVPEEKINVLISMIDYAQTPERKPFLEDFILMLKERIQELHPEWTEGMGMLKLREPELLPTNFNLELSSEAVTNPEMAIANARQINDNLKMMQYLKRFVELGGDESNETYLRLKYILAVAGHEDRALLPLYVNKLAAVLSADDFRSWARKRLKDKGKYEFPKKFLPDLFRAYIAVKPEEFQLEELILLGNKILELDMAFLAEEVVQVLDSQVASPTITELRLRISTKYGLSKSSPKSSGTYTNTVYDPTGRSAINRQTLRVVDGLKRNPQDK